MTEQPVDFSMSYLDSCDRIPVLLIHGFPFNSAMWEPQIEDLLARTLDALLKEEPRVRASVLSQRMKENSRGGFDRSSYPEKSFRQFLTRFPHVVRLEQEDSTTYVTVPEKEPEVRPLHLRYRSALKKQRLRVIPANIRFQILKDIVSILSQEQQETCRWRNLIDKLAEKYQTTHPDISKNSINAIMLAARQAQVIRTLKAKTLAMAPVLLAIEDEKPFQEAVKRCDAAYLQGILNSDEPFDLEEAAIALYDTPGYSRYLQVVMKKWVEKV